MVKSKGTDRLDTDPSSWVVLMDQEEKSTGLSSRNLSRQCLGI